jgi:uncharacterized membrane protein
VSVAVVVVAPADREATWRRWADVGSWPDWNTECVTATVTEPVGVGTLLDLTLRHPRSGRPFLTRPRVTETIPGRAFAWEARGLGLRARTTVRFADEPDGTRIDLVADTTGPMALTYRMTMTDRTLAVLYTRMLDALVEDLRP